MGNLKKSKKQLTVKELLNLIDKIRDKTSTNVVLFGDGSGSLIPQDVFLNLSPYIFTHFDSLDELQEKVKFIL